ncbi:MAG: hypothetical protein KDA31_07735 [Phycisphaerales bacterium]|nr:hypothetical protein [Phycisphaerales bacterium]MCB9836726.1 hypothetical protein [Phycisphaera sp.]
MARTKIQAIDVEVPFRIQDLIFSTTDKKGFIRSTNDVFLTMARYSLKDVLGKPHNIVRHPDMPRCVFHLYWEYIQRGDAIGAYVTNIASDGAYYRVYTLATPLQDGYLAIRFKTTSKYQKIVSDLYKQLCAFETETIAKGVSNTECIQASLDVLNEKLRGLGFANYNAFMIATLEEEMRLRDEAMKREQAASVWNDVVAEPLPADVSVTGVMSRAVSHLTRANAVASSLFESVGSLLSLQDKLNQNAHAITSVSQMFEMSSINVSLEASRIGTQARCLSVIANHLGESSQKVCEIADSMREQIDTTSGALGAAVFCLAAMRLQVETMLDFCRKNLTRGSGADDDSQTKLLADFPRQHVRATLIDLLDAIAVQQATLMPTMEDLIKNLRRLDGDFTSVKRSMLTLRFAQLGGKIESSRISNDSAIASLVDSIGKDIIGTVGQISELESDLTTVATDIRMSFRRMTELQGLIDAIRLIAEEPDQAEEAGPAGQGSSGRRAA